MKFLILVSLLFMSRQAVAWELSNPLNKNEVYRSKNPDLEEMTKVVEKDGRCSFATVTWARPNAPKVLENILKSAATDFMCVGDIVLAAGTMQESQGCTAFILDGNDLSTRPFVIRFGYNMVKNKKCSEGGFDALLKDQVLGDLHVGDMLLFNRSEFGAESIVLFSDNSKYITWFKSAKVKAEAATKARLQRHYRKNKDYPKYYSGYQDTKGVAIKEIFTGDPLINTEADKALIEKKLAEETAKDREEEAKEEAAQKVAQDKADKANAKAKAKQKRKSDLWN